MIRIRRFGVALALAGVLGTTLALSPTTLSATATATLPAATGFCDHLAQAIAFLESKPQTPLRDFLLATLRKVDARYCA